MTVDGPPRVAYTDVVASLKHIIKRALARFVPSLRHPRYNPTTHRVVAREDVFVPPGHVAVREDQNIYDPAVFGRFDLATQAVVPKNRDVSLDLDDMAQRAMAVRNCLPTAPSMDRYELALRQLETGSGLCLDACTHVPRTDVRETVEQLGYQYLPIDIEAAPGVQREDLTALSFETSSVARILSCDTLEHVPDYPAALREMHRVLKPGGMAIIHLPVYFYDQPHGQPIGPAGHHPGAIVDRGRRLPLGPAVRRWLAVARVGLGPAGGG